MILGLIIVSSIKKSVYKWSILTLILIYFVSFLEKNNLNWKKASFITYSILNKIDEKKRSGDPGKIFFLNIPNEIEGAYVFRLGFPDALKLYGFDSNRYFAVNFLPRQDLEKMKEESSLVNREGEINLPPDIVLKKRGPGTFDILDHGVLKYTVVPGEHIFYWNIDRLDEIEAGTLRSPD
jgi:hypothetical protein